MKHFKINFRNLIPFIIIAFNAVILAMTLAAWGAFISVFGGVVFMCYTLLTYFTVKNFIEIYDILEKEIKERKKLK